MFFQLKSFKPITNGSRHRKIIKKKVVNNLKIKLLSLGLVKKSGRNNLGKIITYQRGGGHKRLYRFIDLKRQYFKESAKLIHVEYDPNRSAFIGLIKYTSGHLAYILLPNAFKIGGPFFSLFKFSNRNLNLDTARYSGISLPLLLIPKGSLIHNIELIPGKGGQLVRAAGTFATVIEKFKNGYCSIKMPSKEIRLIPLLSIATLGRLSNEQNFSRVFGKAGASRWINKRSSVRGMAMNPIDHPHGGGQGKSKGRVSSTPWGRFTKGPKTRLHVNKFVKKIA